ncbi:uncharacterized protein LOC103315856 [Nasonia vitripennis]|uniref:Uncharacterized protein n=1 Tax=Nasonia vitripennis TaxID=7425 RepID=A0A7M7LQN7_NASVI|nr:uncharacterized protein LOC103315856 [Nasonia vitripennis]
MPGTPLDQTNSSEVSQGLQAEAPQNIPRENNHQNQPAANGLNNGLPAREITQTDKLNKRLLVSFLNRMNSQAEKDRLQSNNDRSEDEAEDDASFE